VTRAEKIIRILYAAVAFTCAVALHLCGLEFCGYFWSTALHSTECCSALLSGDIWGALDAVCSGPWNYVPDQLIRWVNNQRNGDLLGKWNELPRIFFYSKRRADYDGGYIGHRHSYRGDCGYALYILCRRPNLSGANNHALYLGCWDGNSYDNSYSRGKRRNSKHPLSIEKMKLGAK